MRKLSCLLAVLLAMPIAQVAHAQQRGGAAAAAGAGTDAGGAVDAAPGNAARTDPHASANDTPASGFGQVMSVLTSLLAEAARREATGSGEGLVLDNPAIEISVTPVAGQTSLLRAGAGRPTTEAKPAPAPTDQHLAGGDPR